MMTMKQRRGWIGPAVFSYGFRPFFCAGSAYAALIVALWVPWFLGMIAIPTALPPLAWHTHELLFGYIQAIIAGFLLTAVPNWTGRLPVVGWPLAGLFGLWGLGRLLMNFSEALPFVGVMAVCLAFPIVLLLVIAREIIASKNLRNLKVLVSLIVMTGAQVLFYAEVQAAGHTLYSHRLAIAAALALTMIIGSRIVPSFTGNWLKRHRPGIEPAPFGRFDKLSLGLAVPTLIAWVLLPLWPDASPFVAGLMLVASVSEAFRQARWHPLHTLAEPLVTVLHAAYGFIPLGFALTGLGIGLQNPALETAAIHTWTIGGIGLMTLAVMSRATRGHTGRELTAPRSTVALYAALGIAVGARLLAALLPEIATVALSVAAVAWCFGFGGFAFLYGGMLLTARR